MNRAKLAVFFVSPNSISRPWLNFELGYVEKSSGVAVICVTIHPVESLAGPIAAHQVVSLNREHKLAAEQLLRLIGDRIPIRSDAGRKNTLQIDSNVYPLDRGWQRYGRGANTREEVTRTLYGIAFGKSVDEGGFRFPASTDSLDAPWEFLVLRANPELGVNVYFVVDLADGTPVKLHVNTTFDVIGFAAHQADEFQIAIPRTDRPETLIINTRSFVSRLGHEPIAVRGLRVCAPTELGNIGMFESRSSIPARLRRGALEVVLP